MISENEGQKYISVRNLKIIALNNSLISHGVMQQTYLFIVKKWVKDNIGIITSKL